MFEHVRITVICKKPWKTYSKTSIFRRFFWLILLIPFQVTGQGVDYPVTSLARLQKAFSIEAAKADYEQMIRLMDSITTMETAIDRKARPRLLKTFAGYAPLFEKSIEGQVVHHLYMHTRFPESRDTYSRVLPTGSRDMAGIPATPYQELLLPQDIVYPCKDLYELALFVLEEYKTLIGLLESGRGNVPHNLIAARFLHIDSEPFPPEEKMARLDSLVLEFPKTEPIAFVYLEKVRLLVEKQEYDKALQLSRETLRKFPKSKARESLKEYVGFLTAPSLTVRLKKQVYPHTPFQVLVTRRNLSRYKLEIRQEKGKRTSCFRKSKMNAPVYEVVTDTLILPQAPVPGTYRIRVKKGRTENETTFYSGTVASMFRTYRNTAYVYATDLKTGEPFKKAEIRFAKDSRPSYSIDMNGFTPVDVRAGESFRVSSLTPLQAVPDTFSVPFTVRSWDFSYGTPSDVTTSAALFTDRKLYGKEDTLFFKGIVTRYSHQKSEPLVGKKFSLVLRNHASYRDTLYTVDVVTNEYGSFSGFIPPGIVRINGVHSLTIPGASAQIRIEEYSRPSFSIDLQPIKQAYTYGDTLVQEGVVTNYAGFPLAGVAVGYRVFRQPLFRPYYRDPHAFPTTEQPYWVDTVYTNTDGWFYASFPAEKEEGSDNLHRFVLQVHFTAVDPSGETRQQQTFLPISDYRYTIRSRIGVARAEATNRILVLEKEPFLALDVKNSTGLDQEVQGTYALSRNGIKVFSGTFTGKETTQPPWSKLESGLWNLSFHLEGAAPHKEAFYLVSVHDTVSPADTAAFFCPLSTTVPSFLLGTVHQTLYALAEWYAGDSLLKKDLLVLQPGMQRFSFGNDVPVLYPLEVRLIAIREGVFHEFKHLWEEPTHRDFPLQWVSLRNVTGPYSKETFRLKLPTKEKAEVLVSIFNKSTDRFQPNSFHYQPARAPYVPIPYVRHHIMETTTGFATPIRGPVLHSPVLYSVASRAMGAGEPVTAESDFLANEEAEDEVGAEVEPEMGAEVLSKARIDFEETLAFLPHLIPDSTGYVPVNFQTNGLLSTFRILALAHTTDGKSTTAEETVTVRKEVMALPFFPAYIRSGDSISLTCRVVNLTLDTLEGKAYLMADEDRIAFRPATLFPSAPLVFRWDYRIPQAEALQVPLLTLTAGFESPSHNDAEIHTLPVLSRMEQVTRAHTKTLQGDGVVTLVKKDKESQPHLEVSTPFSSALQALPVLCEPESNNLTSWVAAFYANNIGAHILERFPYLGDTLRANIQDQMTGFEKNSQTGALLLEETPWFSYPKQEALRKQRLLRLEDPAYVRSFNAKAVEQFRALQRQDGGFSWFPGMESSYLLTLHFLEKIGDMIEKRVLSHYDELLLPVVSKAIHYTDSLFIKNTSREELLRLGRNVNLYF
ncbi:MAG: hypothetical protein GX877_01035, partial [Bacteroidales bacterium]|nr:hypothetical protein [Bacteroidales bacterium]